MRKPLPTATFILMIVSLPTLPSSAANSITNPTENAAYFPYSDINANGAMDMGRKVRVLLKKSGIIGGESPLIVPPPMGVTWEHFFDAPGTGWTVGTNWKCFLYDEDDNQLDDNAYEIVSGGA